MRHAPTTASQLSQRAFMGFDGYVDTVVRIAPDNGGRLSTMSDLAAYLQGRAGRSGTLSLDRVFRRFGGNMPICAHALGTLGIPVDCAGALGAHTPHPAFAGMSDRCTLHALVEPGECTAIEFDAGKLFLADHGDVGLLSFELLRDAFGIERLTTLLSEAGLVGFFNWGELRNMHAVWEDMLESVLSRLEGKDRILFFDLSDCSARDVDERLRVLQLLRRFRAHGRVVLSLNDNECLLLSEAVRERGTEPDRKTGATSANQATAAAGERPSCDAMPSYDAMLEIIHATGAADVLVHHGLASAAVRTEEGLTRVCGERVLQPRITTGGGDHFNAGFAFGLLQGLPPVSCAALGNHVSRIFVTEGVSPTRERLRADPACQADFPLA